MKRYDFFFRQKVEEGELDEAFQAVEDAVNAIMVDHRMVGIVTGLVVTQQASPNLTVQVSGPGVAFDQIGQRISIASTQNVNCVVDENGINTAVAAPGNQRYISIFAEFDRTLTDPRLDGNANTVYYDRAESFKLNVANGAESVTPTRPALRSDQVLLADILLSYGTTTITTGMISTTRREDAYVLADTPNTLRGGTAKDVITQLLGLFNDHLDLAAGAHAASAISYAGGVAWADGNTNPAATVEAQIDKILSDLASAVGDGASKIGLLATGFNTWADGTVPAGATIRAMLLHIVGQLGGSAGGSKVGFLGGGSAWADATAPSGATITAILNSIVSQLAATTFTSGGAAKIGIGGSGIAWADAVTFSSSSLRTMIAKIVNDLAATVTTGGTDRIGTRAITASNTNPQVVISPGPLWNALVVLSNNVHNAMNDAFYLRIANAQMRVVASAAVVAGDGVIALDYSTVYRRYFAVRRVAAGDDIIYNGANLIGSGLTTANTITSTTLISLRCGTQLLPMAVGTKNPTTSGALVVYYNGSWNTATLIAPATANGASARDSIYFNGATRYIVAGIDPVSATVFFQYTANPAGSWSAGTVTATNAQPNQLATDESTSIVCVGNTGWVWYSTSGLTWSRVQIAGSANLIGVCWNQTRGRYVAITSSNVYESTDATGSAWGSALTLPTNLTNLTPTFSTIACDDEGRMVVGFKDSSLNSYLGCTVDYFQTFRAWPVEGPALGFEADPESNLRYSAGRFMHGDYKTGGKGAAVCTMLTGASAVL